MKMEYKLLDNGTGVILTRQPEIVDDELYIGFAEAPADATAIFEVKGGDSYYRALSDGLCKLPASKLSGEVTVTVALMNGETPLRRWACEEFKAVKQRNGGTLIAPNDMNLPLVVVGLRLEHQELSRKNAELEAKIGELEEMLAKIMEGYDFT